jgi:DNA topoisomerase-1
MVISVTWRKMIWALMSIIIFKPKYIVPADKDSVVKELRSIAKKSDEVWLASDEDREGESISWHLAEVLT